MGRRRINRPCNRASLAAPLLMVLLLATNSLEVGAFSGTQPSPPKSGPSTAAMAPASTDPPPPVPVRVPERAGEPHPAWFKVPTPDELWEQAENWRQQETGKLLNALNAGAPLHLHLPPLPHLLNVTVPRSLLPGWLEPAKDGLGSDGAAAEDSKSSLLTALPATLAPLVAAPPLPREQPSGKWAAPRKGRLHLLLGTLRSARAAVGVRLRRAQGRQPPPTHHSAPGAAAEQVVVAAQQEVIDTSLNAMTESRADAKFSLESGGGRGFGSVELEAARATNVTVATAAAGGVAGSKEAAAAPGRYHGISLPWRQQSRGGGGGVQQAPPATAAIEAAASAVAAAAAATAPAVQAAAAMSAAAAAPGPPQQQKQQQAAAAAQQLQQQQQAAAQQQLLQEQRQRQQQAAQQVAAQQQKQQAAPEPQTDALQVLRIARPRGMEITVNKLAPLVKEEGGDSTVDAVEEEGWGDLQEEGELLLRQLRADRVRRTALANTARLRDAQTLEQLAVATASAVRTKQDASQFRRQVGLGPLLAVLSGGGARAQRVDAARALTRIVQLSPAAASDAVTAANAPALASGLSALLCGRASALAINRRPRRWRPSLRRPTTTTSGSGVGGADAELAAVELVHALLAGSDAAVRVLQAQPALVAQLRAVAAGAPPAAAGALELLRPARRALAELRGRLPRVLSRGRAAQQQGALCARQRLAYKCVNMLGAGVWVPKTRGQRGLRVLCFDGGGTRGVLTIALLKRIMAEVGREPPQVFDLIVGTSTGAIIAALCALEQFPLLKCEAMYDSLIKDIFQKHPTGGVKLALRQAFYDEENWMEILRQQFGDKTMIDFADTPRSPKVAFPSTVISVNPSKLWLWRNYNYPAGHTSRYSGSYRYTVRESVRATTAAPAFFSPLLINGTLYSDGALMANNPTAVALHEAKHIYPGVPVELVVSLGTGCFFETARDFSDPTVGWDGIINQLVSSATETENTNDIMSDLVGAGYYRFNPRMTDMAIDETRPERLAFLKELAGRYFEEPETRAKLDALVAKLKG